MSSKLALITFLTDGGGAVDPGFGVRPPVDPGYGHPGYGGGHPGNALPGGGHITTLPVFPFDPTLPSNELPGSQPGVDNSLPGSNARPDNELPRPGKRYVVKWLACQGLILVPDNTLPPTPEPK